MQKKYDDTNRWFLFPEQNKKNPAVPDYTGEVDINGTKYRLAGWKKVSKEGKSRLKGQVEPKDAKAKPEFNDSVEF